jgi:cardiolipin synthase
VSNLPNIITILRILLVLPTAWFLWESRFLEAFVLMIITGLSDALDGYLARRFDWMSKLGATLDPLADKLLVSAVFIVFTLQGHIPLWLAAIVLLRDFTIVIGAGVYKLLYEEVEIAPTFLSKANTAIQIITLCLVLASLLPFGILTNFAAQLLEPCFYLLAVLGFGSGLDYVVTWGSKAYRESKKRKQYKHGRGSFRRTD